MSISTQSSLQSAGEINIEQLFLVSNSGTSLSLLDYLVELNIYESIFNNVLSGDVLLSDSRNLIKEMNLKIMFIFVFTSLDLRFLKNIKFSVWEIKIID